MNNKCRYILELEKKIIRLNKICKIFIMVILSFVLIFVNIRDFEFLFVDSEGKFSAEIFWSAIGAIAGIIAFGGVIYTIIYTEKSRIEQNEYEYKKQQLAEEQLKFKEQIMYILDEVNPACFIEILTRANQNNFWQINHELTKYRFSIKNLNYKLYWYYSEEIRMKVNSQNTKLIQFANELNNIIDDIENCINAYSNELIPIYYDMEMEKHFSEIIRLGGKLNENDNYAYDIIKKKYPDGVIENTLLQKVNAISINVIEYSNKNWNNFIELAKEVVSEREKIIEDILKSI